jgi:hypothetical protein
MEQRLKNLEDLSELLTKQMVNQSKSMIEVNKNLLGEIKSLREAYVKQNVSLKLLFDSGNHFMFVL